MRNENILQVIEIVFSKVQIMLSSLERTGSVRYIALCGRFLLFAMVIYYIFCLF